MNPLDERESDTGCTSLSLQPYTRYHHQLTKAPNCTKSIMGFLWTEEEDHFVLFYYLFTGLTSKEIAEKMNAARQVFHFLDQVEERNYTHSVIDRRIVYLFETGHWVRDHVELARLIRYMQDHDVDGYFYRIAAAGKDGLEPALRTWNLSKNYNNFVGLRGRVDITRRTIADLCYLKLSTSDNVKHSVHPRCWREDWVDAFVAYYADLENNWEDHSSALAALHKAGFPPNSKLKFPMTLQIVQASRDYWISWGFIRGSQAKVIRNRNKEIVRDNRPIGYMKDGALVERYPGHVATQGQLLGDASDIGHGKGKAITPEPQSEIITEGVNQSNLEQQIINIYFDWD